MENGEKIEVSVISINSYGESEPSPIGSGAFIFSAPQAPINLKLVEVFEGTSFKLIWQEPNSELPIVHYSVYFSKGTSDLTLIKDGITDLFFV
jgi:hypothetical protein